MGYMAVFEGQLSSHGPYPVVELHALAVGMFKVANDNTVPAANRMLARQFALLLTAVQIDDMVDARYSATTDEGHYFLSKEGALGLERLRKKASLQCEA
ncbi:hypothetical protein LTR84_000917 [Exophiala bonariae]|uniref:Uncharacterized protein n=1 Tax=Exophiala bonariae TaxID=1690606 RepID=A0AAV9NSE6_9EURO|nr:hypothetical protein LTR84_000917 [Exophiala bonariae]